MQNPPFSDASFLWQNLKLRGKGAGRLGPGMSASLPGAGCSKNSHRKKVAFEIQNPPFSGTDFSVAKFEAGRQGNWDVGFFARGAVLAELAPDKGRF